MKDVAKFDAEYVSSQEDAAQRERGVFIKKFPSHLLRNLTLDEYVVGRGNQTFCNLVESGTKTWANIQGATSFKFGVYFGKTKSDSTREYRFAAKFGRTVEEAFAEIKRALLDLIVLGAQERPDFEQIDANPLAQTFKAKILSLYYPKRFLAVCSGEHLEMLGSELGLPQNLPDSRYQNLLIDAKQNNPTTRRWSEPKFMAYLYHVYIWVDEPVKSPVEKPHTKRHRRIDFEEIQRQRDQIGRKAEEYALRWEKGRLYGAQLEHLITRIEDRRAHPGYGYDFLSYSNDHNSRFIEVKSVAKLSDGHRFFLSDNERQTSSSTDHRTGYYFYLVFFDGKGEPFELLAILAESLYPKADISAASYEVRFDRKHFE